MGAVPSFIRDPFPAIVRRPPKARRESVSPHLRARRSHPARRPDAGAAADAGAELVVAGPQRVAHEDDAYAIFVESCERLLRIRRDFGAAGARDRDRSPQVVDLSSRETRVSRAEPALEDQKGALAHRLAGI